MTRNLAHDFEELGLDREEFRGRLDSKVQKSEGCWFWVGYLKDKYGVVRQRVGARSHGKMINLAAHRLAFWLANPETKLPADLLVLHSCNNPPCVNPEHLRLGTHEENMRDKIASGVHAGANNPRARVTEADVVCIRELRAEGKTLKVIAAEYKTHLATIDVIVRGKAWKQTAGPIQPRKLKGRTK